MKTKVIISNNGNHSGSNRTWTLVDSFSTESEANERVKEIESENSDIEHGLTICKAVNEMEIAELKEEGNILINF